MEQPKESKQVTNKALDHAADLLLSQLPDNCGELVVNLKDEYQIPLWHLFCGILLAMHQEGRLSAFVLDPAWREGLKQTNLKCEKCGKTFKPKYMAQKYCSNVCGTEANMEQIRKERAESEKTKTTTPTKDLKLKLTQLEQNQQPVKAMTNDSGTNTESYNASSDGLPSFIPDNGDMGGDKSSQNMAR